MTGLAYTLGEPHRIVIRTKEIVGFFVRGRACGVG